MISFKEQVRLQTEFQAHGQIYTQAREQVTLHIWLQVWGKVRYLVWGQAGDQVKDQI